MQSDSNSQRRSDDPDGFNQSEHNPPVESKLMPMTPVEPVSTVGAWAVEPIVPSTSSSSTQRARTPDGLVTLFSSEVWRFASSQIGNREDSEDVVMEVFAAAFSNFSKIEKAADQRLWLLAIARKKVADCLRKRYRRAERPLHAEKEQAGASVMNDDQIATRGALDGLPANEREALILKYVNGLSTEEVGVVIHRSSAATNSLLQRARQSLRAALGPNFLLKTGDAL